MFALFLPSLPRELSQCLTQVRLRSALVGQCQEWTDHPPPFAFAQRSGCCPGFGAH